MNAIYSGWFLWQWCLLFLTFFFSYTFSNFSRKKCCSIPSKHSETKWSHLFPWPQLSLNSWLQNPNRQPQLYLSGSIHEYPIACWALLLGCSTDTKNSASYPKLNFRPQQGNWNWSHPSAINTWKARQNRWGDSIYAFRYQTASYSGLWSSERETGGECMTAPDVTLGHLLIVV